MHELLNTPTVASNELVAARYAYTATEINLLCTIISKVNSAQFAQIQFTVAELAAVMGDTGRNYEYLRAAFRGLMAKPFELYDFKARIYTGFVVVCGYKLEARHGIVMVNIGQFALAHLHGLKQRFTVFQLSAVLRMKSKYAKRLYLLCSQWKADGTMQMPVADLRAKFKLETKYTSWADLRKRVIEPALNEINALSDLRVKLEPTQQGRVVDVVKFIVLQAGVPAHLNTRDGQVAFMDKCKLSQWQIDNVLGTLTAAQIHPILVQASQRFNDKAAKFVANKGAYLAAKFAAHGVPMDKAKPQPLRVAEPAALF